MGRMEPRGICIGLEGVEVGLKGDFQARGVVFEAVGKGDVGRE